AAQLLRDLEALCKTGSTQRMPLRQQAAGWIGHELAAVRVGFVDDELFALAFGGETKRLVREKLVLGKAIVKLDDVDIGGADAGGFVHLPRRIASHLVADERDHVVRGERPRRV